MEERDPYQIELLGRAHSLRLLAEEGIISLKVYEMQYVITAEDHIKGGKDLANKQAGVVTKLFTEHVKPKMKEKLREIEDARKRAREVESNSWGHGEDSV